MKLKSKKSTILGITNYIVQSCNVCLTLMVFAFTIIIIIGGKKHDIKNFRTSDAASFFTNTIHLRNGNIERIHPSILADSGYQGVHDIYREMIIPHKKPRDGELSMEEKMSNN